MEEVTSIARSYATGQLLMSCLLQSAASNDLGASDGVIHSSISLEVASLRAAANKT